ncbi:ABC transporter ATP-binding protein [Nocardioides marmorisolisilvae]|uniref:ABC transporter ATP-binding protein n=1 Tax=Nocardioides marmorisolisilvae TaxID=1542737 RepID=A0A3N0DXJ0_9ACTN|nr:ABC transporter ATP-binding protein [Nocardioides marmorisolisilvae]RNL80216.1 ABC transporter ATP-binding protein [Nocardioides marmorisolisilvae]
MVITQPAAPGPAIRLDDLTKTFGPLHAVSGLTLEVAAGQVFGFLGPNGAGKSTTIRMIMGLSAPSSGTATVLGTDAWDDGPGVRARIGYLAGELALPPRLTGDAILGWTARARNVENRSRRHELAERFQADLRRPVGTLSKGNRQKIGIIRAFEHDPELLVLDEPTSGLDPLLQKQFDDLLAETVQRGRTVFLSSHELDEVQRVAHNIAIIRGGELVLADTVSALRARAPRSVELTFSAPVDKAEFDALPGVQVLGQQNGRLVLAVSGEVGPLLEAAASHHAIDILARPADLDVLFRSFYRAPQEVPVAR